jgi:UDPglucose 6-dehydrogenase
MENITVIGTGYVGLVSGACLADFGNNVICVDINAKKIEDLNKGKVPIYEPGLDEVIHRNVTASRLSFSTEIADSINAGKVIFIAVGTPPREDGSADLSYIENAARTVGKIINDYKIIVDKSTVPVGTGKKVYNWINDEIKNRGPTNNNAIQFDVVSNPEFLREGAAVQDFMHPDRIVIGTESKRAGAIMKDVYSSLYLNDTPYIETNIETAECIKYASNAFLAVKIAYINEIANLCEKIGANINDVAKGMGRDKRIGSKFLHAGAGYGGSCFPKDTRALAYTGAEYNSELSIINAAIAANEGQKQKMVEKIQNQFGDVNGKTIAVLGLSFKPNTDDIRESPAIFLINNLLKSGAKIRASDPAAINEAKKEFLNYTQAIQFFENEYIAIKNADALVIITEWNQYRNLDMERIKTQLKGRILFDFRNIYNRDEIENFGIKYIGVGQ